MGKYINQKVKFWLLGHNVLQEEGEDESNDILSPYHDEKSNEILKR